MPTVSIITGDSPGNQTLDAAVVNQDANPPTTDIQVVGSGVPADIADIAPPTAADKPNASGPTTQTINLTVNGTGFVSGRVGVYGSQDGMNWQGLGSVTASGQAPATASQAFTNPFTYWTTETEFCSPGATCSTSISY